ncbi:MAG: hypothetical protein L6Q83_11010 [Gammaproteobacteria bacterium]|nr:hypothetical protein [Gammaproteobacteria bacterium]
MERFRIGLFLGRQLLDDRLRGVERVILDGTLALVGGDGAGHQARDHLEHVAGRAARQRHRVVDEPGRERCAGTQRATGDVEAGDQRLPEKARQERDQRRDAHASGRWRQQPQARRRRGDGREQPDDQVRGLGALVDHDPEAEQQCRAGGYRRRASGGGRGRVGGARRHRGAGPAAASGAPISVTRISPSRL